AVFGSMVTGAAGIIEVACTVTRGSYSLSATPPLYTNEAAPDPEARSVGPDTRGRMGLMRDRRSTYATLSLFAIAVAAGSGVPLACSSGANVAGSAGVGGSS